jgi:hypothetical protein
MRGLRSTIILAVLALGLGGYIYFVESKKEPSSDLPKKDKVFALESDKVQEVRIKSESGETTTVRKSGDAWQVVEPAPLAADQAELSSITSNLSSLEMQRVVDENASDLAGYGLAKPRIEVAFKAASDKDYRRLQLGDKTATGGDLYAKLANDKKVFLISGYLESTFNKTTFDLRDKSALKFDRDKVDSITVETADHTVQASKQSGEWKLTQPVQGRADYGAVEGILGRLNTAQMKKIVTQDAKDLKEYGLDKPAVTATLAAGSSRAALQIGKAAEEGNVYARDTSRPAVFTVESSLLDELKKGPGDYRRKDLFEFRPFNAARVEIVRDGKTYAFEKVKGTGKDANTEKWRQVAPSARDVDATKIDTLLSRLSNLRAQSFVDERTALSKPEVTVIARYDEKKEERVVFAKSGADVLAGRAEEPGAATVQSNEYDDALKALDDVLK